MSSRFRGARWNPSRFAIADLAVGRSLSCRLFRPATKALPTWVRPWPIPGRNRIRELLRDDWSWWRETSAGAVDDSTGNFRTGRFALATTSGWGFIPRSVAPTPRRVRSTSTRQVRRRARTTPAMPWPQSYYIGYTHPADWGEADRERGHRGYVQDQLDLGIGSGRRRWGSRCRSCSTTR